MVSIRLIANVGLPGGVRLFSRRTDQVLEPSPIGSCRGCLHLRLRQGMDSGTHVS